MGGFLLYNKNSDHISFNEALNIFVKKRQKISKDIIFGDYRLITFNKRSFENQNFFQFDNGDFVASLGTPIYKKLAGEKAARELYNDFKRNPNPDFTNFYGHFCYIIYFDRKLFLFNDFNGIYQVYNDAGRNIFSNSFLAISNSLNNKNISNQGLYEYIFYGSAFGEDTIIEDIKRLDYKSIFQLAPEMSSINKTFCLKKIEKNNLKFDDFIEIISGDLINYFDVITNNYDKFSLGLSGGFDSRLILALLLKCNTRPVIYVNGHKDSLEVKISASISDAFGLEFENYSENENLVLEKDSLNEIIKEKFYLDEGLNVFGIFNSILSKDVEISQRAKTNLNGSGGETYRAYRGLPNKKIDLKDYINLKYDYSPAIAANKFNKNLFFEKFSKKIINNLDTRINNSKLTPELVDLIPPAMRGRYWTGVSCSKVNQFCFSLLPFLEPIFYLKNIYIPYEYKIAGKFEAALIKKINPELAKFKSNYGFNFYDGANLKAKIKDRSKMYTPVWMRYFLKGIKNINSKPEHFNYIRQRERIIFNNDNMHISEYINLGEISSKYIYSRALTVEYFLRNFM